MADRERPYDPLAGMPSIDGAAAVEAEMRMSERAKFMHARLISADEIELDTSNSYLVKGWLGRSSTSMIYGDSNTGKSFLACYLAQSIASGAPFGGVRSIAGGVLYIACEGGTSIQQRMLALSKVDRSYPIGILPIGIDLTGSNDAQAICEMIAALPFRPALIIIDTLSQASPDADENAAKDMTRFVRSVETIREATQAHLLIIHHCGKNRDAGARGHSSLRAAVDTEIRLEQRDGLSTATITKQRDGPTGPSIAYRLRPIELGEDEDGDPITTCVVEVVERSVVKPRLPKLAGREEIALEALQEAIREHGRVVSGPDYPAKARVVATDKWRAELDKHNVCNSDKPDSLRKAYNRSRDKLVDANYVRIFKNLAWVVPDVGQSGQSGQI